MMVVGKKTQFVDLENQYNLQEMFMKVNGKIIKGKEMDFLNSMMEILIKENGVKTREMEKGYLLVKKEISMMVFG